MSMTDIKELKREAKLEEVERLRAREITNCESGDEKRRKEKNRIVMMMMTMMIGMNGVMMIM